MKKFVVFPVLLACIYSYSQNLVPNPSFEEYDTCPNSLSQINYAADWWSARGTPDYYNICADTFCSIPNNLMGHQYPLTGNGYAGYINVDANSGREYIGVELTDNTIAGKRYLIGFAINRSDGINGGRVISNKMGLFFSNALYDVTTPKPVNNFAHFKIDTFITDTINWINIAATFLSDSSYRYMYIGNFYDDEHTDTLELTFVTNNRSYYYIDDVFVIQDTATSQNEIHSKIISSYFIDANHLAIENAKGEKIKIIDSNGLLKYENEKIETDSFIIDVTNISFDILIVIIFSFSVILYKRKHLNP